MDDVLKERTVLAKLKGKAALADDGKDIARVKIFENDFPPEAGMSFEEISVILQKIEAASRGDIYVESVDRLSLSFQDYLKREGITANQFLVEQAFFNVRIVIKRTTQEQNPSGLVIDTSRKKLFVKYGPSKAVSIGRDKNRTSRLLMFLSDPDFGIKKTEDSLIQAILIPRDKNFPPKNWADVIENTMKEINRLISEAGKDFKIRLRKEAGMCWLEIETSSGTLM